ncbi:SinI family restriction endonuclease [Clostridium sp.]|uniref:SinI family restriction endonuclease n=1 Tax=Clostridium sp. TaxID=1506 RepID=UPI002624AB99
MAQKKISAFKFTDEEALRCFEKYSSDNRLKTIFKICLEDKKFFVSLNFKNNEKTIDDYVRKWIEKYCNACLNLPSQKTAKPKDSCDDPVLNLMIENIKDLSEEESSTWLSHHNLFMSAENIQGELLEQYIANKLDPSIWFWCRGPIVYSTDFCTLDGKNFLQIKNKYNTENSSSDKVRDGRRIIKWFRVKKGMRHKKPYPKFNWESLNKILNSIQPECNYNLNEDDYRNFILDVIKKNKNIITEM